MRRAVLAIVVVGLVLLLGGTALAVTGSDVATASLTIDNIVVVDLTWLSTGTPSLDFGTVPPDTILRPHLVMDVTHNMGPVQSFLVTATVDQPAGPAWDSLMNLVLFDSDLYWGPGGAAFGTPQDFFDSVGGAESFQEEIHAELYVSTTQPNGTYTFEFTIMLTSL
jgi:hypothetical protein